jgi:hypothetical protein
MTPLLCLLGVFAWLAFNAAFVAWRAWLTRDADA